MCLRVDARQRTCSGVAESPSRQVAKSPRPTPAPLTAQRQFGDIFLVSNNKLPYHTFIIHEERCASPMPAKPRKTRRRENATFVRSDARRASPTRARSPAGIPTTADKISIMLREFVALRRRRQTNFIYDVRGRAVASATARVFASLGRQDEMAFVSL